MAINPSSDAKIYGRILVPIDGSPLSVAALDYASSLAARVGAQVFLLHVSDPKDRDREPLYQAYLDRLAEKTRDCFKEIHSDQPPEQHVYIVKLVRPLSRQTLHYREVEIADPSNKKVHVLTVMGPTAEQIASYAEEQGMDLVVMATHGRSADRHWPVDSVAMAVTRCCTVPVRLVRVRDPEQPACDDWPDQKILVLLDGSEASEQALPYALQHARLCAADLHLLRVWEPSMTGVYVGSDERLTLQEHRERALAQGHEECNTYLWHLAERLGKAGAQAKIHALLGDPGQEIVQYITANNFDLVIMTTHAQCGEGLWPMGSMTDKVLHRTETPVLLVPPK